MALVFLLGRWDRRCARLGLLYILCFHLWVCLTPEPNNISLFAVQCASRLTIVLDPSALHAASMKIGSYAFAFSALGILAVACGIQAGFTPLNWGFMVFIPLFLFMHLAVFAETGTKVPTPATRSRRRPWWTYLATSVAWGVFLWDNHARRHGRSNAEHVREPEDARMIWNSFPKQQSLPERIISNPSSLNGTPLEFSEIKWSVPATCTTRKGMRSSTVWDCCKQAVPDKKLARQRRCDDLQATTPYSEPV